MTSLPNSSSSETAPSRDFYLDNLRVFCMIGIFFYHGTRFFDPDYWHVKSATPDPALTTWGFFLIEWLVCLFFWISGCSAFHALRRRPFQPWLTSRFLRLFVPYAFGVFALAPIQVYQGRLSHHQYSGSFFSWFPQYFHGSYLAGGNFAWMGLHLWFLLVLFVFSPPTLLLLLALRDLPNRRLFHLNPALLLLLSLVPLLLIELFLKPTGLATKAAGGWSLFFYFALYSYGYALVQLKSVQQFVMRWRFAFLMAALASCALLLHLRDNPDHAAYGTSCYQAFGVIRVVHCLSWILCALGLSQVHCNFTNSFLGYAAEASLPFYIIHQPILVSVGFYVVRWNWNPLATYLTILAIAFPLICVVYHFIVRRFAVTRWLCGLKART